MSWPTTYAEIDTLPLATRKLRHLRSRRLEVVAADLGVPLENAHRAFHDADATGRVFLESTKRHGAPHTLEGLVEWGVAVSQPPNTGHIATKDKSGPEFIFGPHEGQLVEHHPDYLQWMILPKPMWMVSGSIVSRLLFVSGHISFCDPVWAVEKIPAIEVGQEMLGTWICSLAHSRAKRHLWRSGFMTILLFLLGCKGLRH